MVSDVPADPNPSHVPVSPDVCRSPAASAAEVSSPNDAGGRLGIVASSQLQGKALWNGEDTFAQICKFTCHSGFGWEDDDDLRTRRSAQPRINARHEIHIGRDQVRAIEYTVDSIFQHSDRDLHVCHLLGQSLVATTSWIRHFMPALQFGHTRRRLRHEPRMISTWASSSIASKCSFCRRLAAQLMRRILIDHVSHAMPCSPPWAALPAQSARRIVAGRRMKPSPG